MSGLFKHVNQYLLFGKEERIFEYRCHGGLERFSEFLQSNGNSEKLAEEDLDSLLNLFTSYADLPFESRQIAIEAVLAWLQDEPSQKTAFPAPQPPHYR